MVQRQTNSVVVQDFNGNKMMHSQTSCKNWHIKGEMFDRLEDVPGRKRCGAGTVQLGQRALLTHLAGNGVIA